MPIRLDQYLTTQGFAAHPFATTNAEREVSVLPSFFVRVSWFDWLMGNPSQPESVILFAPQGYGKTSHRMETARRASERRNAPALVITISDFSTLLHDGIEHVTFDTYLTVIRRLTLEALDTQVGLWVQRGAKLDQEPGVAAYLHALMQLYAPRRIIGRLPPPGVDDFVKAIRSEALGHKEWLQELSRVAAYAGFASVYCLVDGIDELMETRNQPAMMFRLLSPLLDAPGLLQECGFAFKLFLPQDIAAEMKLQNIGRLDRIPNRMLTWSDDQLFNMLSQRLVSFNRFSGTSPLTRVRTFQDLCQADFDVDRYLVRAATGSPRRLIDLARLVLEEHCEQASSVEELISAESVYRGVRRGLNNDAPPAPTTSAPVTTTPALPPAPKSSVRAHGSPPLFIDDHGDIWLGVIRLSIALTALQRRFLDYLWQHRHQRVSYDELFQELYGNNLDKRADPKESIDKLARRLRRQLEPDNPASQTYIELQSGSGYVLRNFRDR